MDGMFDGLILKKTISNKGCFRNILESILYEIFRVSFTVFKNFEFIDLLEKEDTQNIFGEPVDPDEVPDYLDMIKKPMDFSTMRSKVELLKYENFEDFEVRFIRKKFLNLGRFFIINNLRFIRV